MRVIEHNYGHYHVLPGTQGIWAIIMPCVAPLSIGLAALHRSICVVRDGYVPTRPRRPTCALQKVFDGGFVIPVPRHLRVSGRAWRIRGPSERRRLPKASARGGTRLPGIWYVAPAMVRTSIPPSGCTRALTVDSRCTCGVGCRTPHGTGTARQGCGGRPRVGGR